MTTVRTTWRRWMELSIAAKEEQDRLGHPQIDMEHLFLAQLVTGGAAGRVLGELGVTLRDARAASARVHAEQLASIGLDSRPLDPDAEIPDPFHGDFNWSKRAESLMRTLETQSR